MSFVERTTDEGSPDFVPVPQRIAVFDNDGCLWPENPIPFQLAFAVEEINRMVSEEPALKEDPMVAALLAGDTAKLLSGPRHEGLLRIIALTHAGMTTEEFSARVQDWIGTAEHPIVACGNSDGDTQVLKYTTIDNPQPSLGVLIHHTDGVREDQYDVNPTSSGTLVEALRAAPQRGWTVVSMKDDWRQIFSES